MTDRTISWSKTALNQFNVAIRHIMEDSAQNAEKVRMRLLLKIGRVAESPGTSPKDKYKVINDGSYRAFELYHYRVTYRIIKNGIKIIRFRHTSMVPKLH